MKTILVLEDSSRVNFGGGQKITLIVANILKDYFNLRFVDYSASTRYAETVMKQYGNNSFINIGHINVNGQKSLWLWIKMTLATLFFVLSDAQKVLKQLNKGDCISYSTNKRTLMFAVFLKWIYGIPFVHHAHLVEKKNGMYFVFARWLFQKAKTVLCVSNTVRESIKTDNCRLLFNPSLNKLGFKGFKKTNNFIVAYVGSLIPIKGVDCYIDAAKRCLDSIEFRVYGEGPLLKELDHRAKGRVKFLGFDANIIDKYYTDIDIIVVPTLIEEALSLVVVDAKSVGIPVVVTSPGGQAEIVEDGINGYHVPVNNPQAIVDSIGRLTSDLGNYNKMARASFESFSKFSYDKFKVNILKVFETNEFDK